MYIAVAAHRGFNFMLVIINLIIVTIVRLFCSATPDDSWEQGGAISLIIPFLQK